MDVEFILIIITLVLMFSTVFAKAITAQLLKRFEKQISMQNQAKAKVLGELKMASAQKGVLEKNKTLLESKKVRLVKRIGKMKEELQAFEQEAAYRQKLTNNMRGKLIRPTRAAPGNGA